MLHDKHNGEQVGKKISRKLFKKFENTTENFYIIFIDSAEKCNSKNFTAPFHNN